MSDRLPGASLRREPGHTLPIPAVAAPAMSHVTRATLPNGLRVVVYENHAAPVVALQAWVDVGSADEVGAEAGIAHVFEHMLFKGTTRRGVGEIARAVEAAGGDINAWTAHDQTVYHLVLASRYFATGLDVLADALENSSFDPVELDRELKVVLEEIKQNEDSPQRVVTQALFRAAYGRHPYGRPVIGTARTVRRFDREQLLVFFRRWYVPSNMTLVVAGDVEPSRALAAAERSFQGEAARRPPRVDPPAPRPGGPRTVLLAQDVHESHVALAFGIPGLHHPDTGALDVAAIVLGQGESSRLNLRVKRAQLVTDCVAYAHSPRGPGLLVVSAASRASGVLPATRALCLETFRLATEVVTAEEIAKAQSIIESDAVYQKETVQGMARKLGFFETVAGGIEFEEEYQRQVARVTPESLRETLARYLKPENLTVAALLPDRKQGAALDRSLVRAATEAARDVLHPARRASVPSRRSPAENDVVRHVLPSGVRVLVRRDASVPLVALRAVWLGGLRAEDAATNGITNLLAALLTRGTSRRGAEEIAREVEGMAGSLAGFSGRNSFGVRSELLARHFERGLDIFAECLLDPALSEEEFDKERRLVLEEIRAQQDNLTSVAFRLFWRGLYQRGPYRFDLLGTPGSLRRLRASQLRRYYQREYPPGDMVLAVVGDVDPDQVIARCTDRFADVVAGSPKRRARAAALPHFAPDPVAHELRAVRDRQQTHLVIGYPGTTFQDRDRFALEVLSTVLSGQGGRLFVELRDKKGLAYRLNAYALEGVDPGYVAVYLACSPANLETARRGVHEELAKVRDTLIGVDELARAQRYLVGSHEIGLQRRTALCASLAFNECYGIGYDEHLRYAPAILTVTRDDVRRVARRFFDREREVVAIVGPEQG